MRIAIIAGGTGGHVCPAWALAQALHAQGHKVTFYTDPRGIIYIPLDQQTFIDLHVLPLAAPSQGKIKFLWSLLRTFIHLLKPFKEDQKPQKAVGFGGYPLLAWGLVSFIKRIPLIIHEQNAWPGRVNRLLARWAQDGALTFPTSQLGTRTTLTGLPLRPNFKALSYTPAFEQDLFRLFIIGGSQGAQFFSKIVPDAVVLLPKTLQERLHIIHQCPVSNLVSTQLSYEQTGAMVELKPYFKDVATQLARAHLVISRAGASTLAEIITVGRPALLIPFPHAVNDHQTVNAQLIQAQGGVWCQKEKELTIEGLAVFIEKAMTYPGLLTTAADSLKGRGHEHALEKMLHLVSR